MTESDSRIWIRGTSFDPKTSIRKPALIEIDPSGQCLPASRRDGCHFSKIHVSPRIGDGKRFLTFPSGLIFESDQNDAIDALIDRFGQSDQLFSQNGRLSLYMAVLAIVLLASWLAFRYGLPAMSERAAMAVPAEILIEQGQAGLKKLDERYLEPSTIETARQHNIHERFVDLLPANAETLAYDLHFRSSDALGANALALPSGDIIVTDQLVKLVTDDGELEAVILHEIAHVEYRHGTQGILQTSVLALGVFALSGDVTSISTLLLGVPALLLNSNYSRRMESEADAYAVRQMLDRGIPVKNLSNILEKLQAISNDAREKGSENSGYLATHPSNEARLNDIKELSSSVSKAPD